MLWLAVGASPLGHNFVNATTVRIRGFTAGTYPPKPNYVYSVFLHGTGANWSSFIAARLVEDGPAVSMPDRGPFNGLSHSDAIAAAVASVSAVHPSLDLDVY